MTRVWSVEHPGTPVVRPELSEANRRRDVVRMWSEDCSDRFRESRCSFKSVALQGFQSVGPQGLEP